MKDTARFVEICDGSGAIAAVVIQQDNGKVRVLTAEDKELTAYAKSYGMKPTTFITHTITAK